MQANVFSWILLQRVTRGGEKQCFDASVKDDANLVDVRCTGADVGVDADGKPLDGGGFVLSLKFTKVCSSTYTSVIRTCLSLLLKQKRFLCGFCCCVLLLLFPIFVRMKNKARFFRCCGCSFFFAFLRGVFCAFRVLSVYLTPCRSCGIAQRFCDLISHQVCTWR